jgi:shikimate kinase
MLIYLIGFMGSGKTTIGKSLSRLLEYEFIDMDHFIEEETGMTIPEIFEKKGEAWFREQEKESLKTLSIKENVIISTGGGTPCYFNNMELIKNTGVSFYLHLTPAAFASRVYNPNTQRPLLKGKSKEQLISYAEEMLEKREPYYKRANYIIESLNLRPETLVNIIKEHVDRFQA